MTSKKEAAPSVVDALADDAVPDEYPEGSPLLLTILQIKPRSKRADFKRKLSGFLKKEDELRAARAPRADGEAPASTGEQLLAWADLDDAVQEMDELMEMAAVNAEAYREWSDSIDDDNQLVTVFNVFIKRAQPGEASRSTS